MFNFNIKIIILNKNQTLLYFFQINYNSLIEITHLSRQLISIITQQIFFFQKKMIFLINPN